MRFWDFEALDNADISGEGRVFELDPIREVKIGGDAGSNTPPVQIRSMIRSLKGDHWLIQDGMGSLWKMDVSTYQCKQIMLFHSGAIVGIDVSPYAKSTELGQSLLVTLHCHHHHYYYSDYSYAI